MTDDPRAIDAKAERVEPEKMPEMWIVLWWDAEDRIVLSQTFQVGANPWQSALNREYQAKEFAAIRNGRIIHVEGEGE